MHIVHAAQAFILKCLSERSVSAFRILPLKLRRFFETPKRFENDECDKKTPRDHTNTILNMISAPAKLRHEESRRRLHAESDAH